MYLAFPIGGCWKGGQSSSCLRTHGNKLGTKPPDLGTVGLPEGTAGEEDVCRGLGLFS